MDVLVAKVLSLLGIFLFSFIFGIAPLPFEKYLRSPKIKWVNNAVICFSGGTLLGITFLHLIPETRDSVTALAHKGHFTYIPPHMSVADIIICGGFFFIYIFDELFHMLLQWLGADHTHQPHGRRLSQSSDVFCSTNVQDDATPTRNSEVGPLPSERYNAIHIPSILTIVALSFHDIFEGLALGIQDHTEDVVFLFLSVATHKYAIAFSVSLDLLLSGVNKLAIVVYTLVFSLVNPFGIALGIMLSIINDHNNTETPMTVFMQGVASGSLIYVVCFEVLQRHGSGKSHAAGIRNTFFVFFGYIFILCMKIWLPHHHIHGEEGNENHLHIH